MKCPQCMFDNASIQTHCQKCRTPLTAPSSIDNTPATPASASATPVFVAPSSIATTPAVTTPEGDSLFRPGQVVNERYTVLGLIGKGGVGTIYKVHDNVLDEDLVLKTLLPQYTQDKMVVERFFNEARIARKLTHANIVRVHDIGSTGSNAYISMEYVEGATLRQILDQRRAAGSSISLKDVLYIMDGLCRALEYAHKFTVHRDIKPDNIMVEKGGVVKLMDFGISKLMDNVQLTGVSMVMGTPYYMSPEQLRDSRDVDGRADIFSVGVVLYELLTGNRPTGVPKPASEMLREIPPILDEIVARCVEPDRELRYQSAAELRNAFKPLLTAMNEGKDLVKEFRRKVEKGEKVDNKAGWNLFGFSSKPEEEDLIRPTVTPAGRIVTPPEAASPMAPSVDVTLDPAYRDLATLDAPVVSRRAASRYSQSVLPDIGRKVFIGCAVIAGIVLLGWGGSYTLARIKDMRNRDVVVAPVYPNKALEMLEQGATPLVALEEAVTAVKQSDTDENRAIAEKVRTIFLDDIRARVTIIPYSSKTISAASEDIARAAQRDSDPRITEMQAYVNDELSHYKFVLMSVDQVKGTAKFILNNPKFKEKDQTVSKGEYLQDRFLVNKVGSNYVSLLDQKVRSTVDNPRPIIARLMEPISDN